MVRLESCAQYELRPVPGSFWRCTRCPDSVAVMLEVVSPDVFRIVLGNVKHRTRFEHDNFEAFFP